VVLHGLGAGAVAGFAVGLLLLVAGGWGREVDGNAGLVLVVAIPLGMACGLVAAIAAHGTRRFADRRGLRTLLGAVPGVLLGGLAWACSGTSLVGGLGLAATGAVAGMFAASTRLVVRPPQAADRFRDAVSDVFE
jgi:hypothetical protein